MNLPSTKYYIQEEETKPRASVSTAMLSRMGSSHNFLLDTTEFCVSYNLNGDYNYFPLPNVHEDGLLSFRKAFEIVDVQLEVGELRGSSGTAEFDLKWASELSNSFVSIFSTTPKHTPSAPAYGVVRTGVSRSGFTTPVLSKTQFDAFDRIRCDVLQAVSGDTSGAWLKVFFRAR